jgi:hypothetical protein
MRISPVEAELFHADRRRKVIVAFRSFANAPKNGRCVLQCTCACSLYTGFSGKVLILLIFLCHEFISSMLTCPVSLHWCGMIQETFEEPPFRIL